MEPPVVPSELHMPNMEDACDEWFRRRGIAAAVGVGKEIHKMIAKYAIAVANYNLKSNEPRQPVSIGIGGASTAQDQVSTPEIANSSSDTDLNDDYIEIDTDTTSASPLLPVSTPEAARFGDKRCLRKPESLLIPEDLQRAILRGDLQQETNQAQITRLLEALPSERAERIRKIMDRPVPGDCLYHHTLQQSTNKKFKAAAHLWGFRDHLDCGWVFTKFYNMAMMFNKARKAAGEEPIALDRFTPPRGCPYTARLAFIASYPSTSKNQIAVDRFETVFSDNVVPEGAANMRAGVSGEMQQHVYWGSMRDRMAAAQTDELVGERAFPKSSTERADKTDTRGKRVQVSGRSNLAMIRSGQDWSNTTPDERQKYLETMHPVLVKGMEFLRDEGEEVGCISNRFMDCTHKTSPGQITERTFGLAYFDDLKSLEGWSKQHKTHLDIFGRFLQYAAELQNNVSLRLFHEVMVLKPEQQYFEYVGCHDTTGMLASV